MDQLRERINFLKTFAADKNVAAVVASSRFVIQDVIKHVPDKIRTAIECGPGEGVMTRALLERLHPEGTLLAIESNKEFVAVLQGIGDRRLRVAESNAQDMIAHARNNAADAPDIVLASIPFSFLKPSERVGFIRDAHAILQPKGTCIIFHQYSPLMYRTMKKIFGNVSLSFEVRNFPPCFIITARKD